MLTLSDALKHGKLREFIAQEEARGIGPANRKDVEAAVRRLAVSTPLTPTQSGGRTSRSPSRGGSTEK